MVFDISNDHLIFDGLKPLLFIQAGTGQQWRIETGLRFPVSAKDAAGSNGTYTQADAKFNLPVVDLKLFKPRAGDFITVVDTGELFTIGQVETLTMGTRLQPWAKLVELNPNTATEVKVMKPVVKKDDTGSPVTAWKLAKVAKAHVNEVASEIEIQAGRRRVKITHQIFFDTQFTIEAGWRVAMEDGSQFNVRRVTGKGSMGKAVVADAEKVRTPTA